MKAVFICGTGRCGTTIAKEVLARHTDVFSFDREARFMDDPYGVFDLYQTLACRWSVWNAQVTWHEFKKLICKRKSLFWSFVYKVLRDHQSKRKAFTLLSPPRYSFLDIHNFEDIVSGCLLQLKEDLDVIEYKGAWLGSPGFSWDSTLCIPLCHEEEKICRAIQSFLENFMGQIIGKSGKKIWVDDSIYAHLKADTLFKVIPDAKIIHMRRDPRDVIASYKTKVWAPADASQGAGYYRSIMTRWEEVKTRLNPNSFMEVGFEELFADPERGFKEICRFIGLPWQEGQLDIDLSRTNTGRWKKDLSEEDIRRITPFIEPYLNNGHSE